LHVPVPQAIPPRRFTPAQLARLAQSSPTMACECPLHLVDIVNSLAAFEKYSAECESRSPADAAMHRLLHSITATARALMEGGLERVVQAEGITL
jgi:MerR family transcriptional regulator, light-induced transcriptional regulator